MIVHILLPTCIRSDHNVFLNILKNIVGKVGHAKLSEHFLDNAFKEGMVATEFQVDFSSAEKWNSKSSKQEKISLSRLIGCWASRNCDGFGKILFKDSWRTVESRTGTPFAMIDRFVFSKMRCILVELNVSETTLPILKHFVKVPVKEIDVENMVQISPRMRVFDIKKDCLENCWKSLKHGEWLGNSNYEVRKKIL